jgi:putative N6-adenine-specific DNA methylase
MFAYQKTNRYFAQIADGLENLGARELAEFGGLDVKPTYRGIFFSADPAGLYKINYKTRLITRVLAPLLTFDCHSDKYLYKTARSMPWKKLLSVESTFAIDAIVTASHIKHSQYAAQKLKDAIVDQFREACGDRPDVDTRDPDIWLHLFIRNNKATISFDTSGGSLHRRGYRIASVEAPMQETVAAAIIRYTGWDKQQPLYDPMCGSGTLLAEAAMRYCRIPAGYLREKFGFMRLPDFDEAVWETVKQKCDDYVQPLPPGLIAGSDKSPAAVEAAIQNCRRLPGGENIAISVRPFQEIESMADSVVVCNPPYGVRLKEDDGSGPLLREFGLFLKEHCPGSTAFVYLGKMPPAKTIPLRASWKKPITSGGLEGYLLKYKIR